MEKLLNVENDWDGEVDCSGALLSPFGTAAGPTGVLSELMKTYIPRCHPWICGYTLLE